MRLYSRAGATSVVHGEGDEPDVYEADENGSVEVPHDLGLHLQNLHVGGVKAWEDDAERQARLDSEELARRRDPAQLYDLLSTIIARGSGAVPVSEGVSAEAVQGLIDAAVADAIAKATAPPPPAEPAKK